MVAAQHGWQLELLRKKAQNDQPTWPISERRRSSRPASFPFNGEYREIVASERLACPFEFEGMPGHVLLETVTFGEHGGKTKLTATDLFDTAQDRDGMLQAGMEEGANESYDRLAELLADLKQG